MKRFLHWTLAISAALWANLCFAQEVNFENIEFQADLSRVVGQLARASCSKEPKTAQAASGALTEIQQAFYQQLLDASDSPDAEIRARVREIFREATFQSCLMRTMNGLSADSRRKLESFAVDHRDMVELCLLGREQQRVAAIQKLRKTADREKSLEPLLRALIYSESQAISSAAAAAVFDLEYKSDELAIALSVALARSMVVYSTDGESPARRYVTMYGSGNSIGPMLDALVQMRSKQAAPMLAAMLTQKKALSYSIPVDGLTQALASTGEKGIIPALIDRLVIDRSDSITTFTVGGVGGTSRRVDAIFYAMVIVARQNPFDYKMVDFASMKDGNPYMPTAGFKDDNARRAAFDKFRQWWKTAKDTPDYKDVQPIELADLSQWAKGRTSTQPAASEPATEPTEQPGVPASQDLRRQMADVMRRHIDNLGADRQSQRRVAQAAIINVLSGMLSSIIAVDDVDNPKGLTTALAQATAEAKIAVFFGDLPKDDRAKLILYRKGHNALLQSVFSDDISTSMNAIMSLPKNDPDSLAEPLLLYSLKQPGHELMQAAAEAIASGHYKSAATVDAMVDIIARTDPRMMTRSYGGQNTPAAKILKAIKEIKPPAATPVLLAHLINRPYLAGDWQADGILIDALEAVGDKRALPVLAENLRSSSKSKRGGTNTVNAGNKKINWSESDSLLYLAVRMTGQKPDDYSLSKLNINGSMVVGFADAKDRPDAVKKYLAWWDENKDKDEYKDLKSLTLPNLTPTQQNNPWGLTTSDSDVSVELE